MKSQNLLRVTNQKHDATEPKDSKTDEQSEPVKESDKPKCDATEPKDSKTDEESEPVKSDKPKRDATEPKDSKMDEQSEPVKSDKPKHDGTEQKDTKMDGKKGKCSNTSDSNLHKDSGKQQTVASKPGRSGGQKAERHPGSRPKADPIEVDKVCQNLSSMGDEECRQWILKQQ